MAKPMNEDEVYAEAKKRVKAKRNFYGNLTVYAVVNAICFLIWAFTDLGGYPWFLWVLGPWGVLGIVPHYLRVFVFEGRSQERAIEQEAEKIRREGA